MGSILVRAAAAGGLYAVAAHLALRWPLEPEGIAPVWPASGVGLVAFLLAPPRGWPLVGAAVAAACVATNALAGYPLGQSLGMAAANVVEPALAAGLLRALLGGVPSVRRLRDIVGLLCLTAPACAAGALVGTLAVVAQSPEADWAAVARQWLASDYVGMLVVGSVALGLREAAAPPGRGTEHRLEALVCGLGLAATGALVFGSEWADPQVHYYTLLPVPFLTWATVRFGTPGAVAGALLFAGTTVVGTLAGRGPFVIPELAGAEPTLGVQLYVAVIVGSMLLLNAALTERAEALEGARAAGRSLEADVDALKRATEAQERLTRILEATPDLVSTAGPDGRLRYANPAARRMLGLGPEEELRAHHIADYHPEWAGRLLREEALPHVAEHGTWSGETAILGHDGREIPVSQVVVAHRAPGGGRILYLSTIMRDLSDRKRAEEQLRRERNFANTSLESLPGIFYLVDEQGRLVRWNRKWIEVSGYDDEDMARLSALDFFRGAERELIAQRIAKVLEEGEATTLAEIVTRDGRSIPHFFTGRRVELDGRPYVVGMGIDVSEQRAAEAHVRRERNFANTVLETIPGLFYVVDRDGRYVRWNRSFETLLGYSDEEVQGLHALDLVPEEDRERVAAIIEGIFRGESASTLIRARAKSGEIIPFLGTGRAWQYGDEVLLVGVSLDMRERLRVESERRALEEQLRQSQRLESVGRLAGGIAHDFNNLLTVILGYAEVALAQSEPRPGAREPVAHIRQAGERARELTRQLLAFSRRQVLEEHVLDPNEVVVGFVPLLRGMVPETVELATELDPGVGRVRADRGQLEQVLMNLAVNAVDAMPEGGRIAIRSAPARLDEGEGRTDPALRPGPYVRLSFTDTGEGMDDETLEQIFEPFFTTKQKHEGTGLGLSTIHGIIKQHGGDIEVESAPGRGTRFDLLLPVQEGAARAEAEEAPPEPEGPARAPGAGCVLLVEDEAHVRSLVERHIGALGYELLVAEGPEDALELARARRDPIELLLTDVVMPGMSGPELYERIADERPEIRVLYMSGYPADALAQGPTALGPGVELLQKPFRLRDLEARLRELLEG